MRFAFRTAGLPLLLILWMAAPRHASGDAPQADDAEPPAQAGSPAPDQSDAEPFARVQRMRGTGTRTGFRHDTRPAGKLASKGQQRIVTREQGEVAPRPTKWRDESVGGKSVHQVRFRREGEPGQGDDHP